ncbi:hypothetical protein [Virgibacillus siamensis]|uniref:hypothetical protein n=1 Tax=Virgibacillus siamensis TaxID=480071 RepID=UPI0009841088|nr:hypothetical protein [Virgibacillus siamensis]
MSKVKLTEYEAKIVKDFEKDYDSYGNVPMSKIVDALCNGYEVEPEYKVGDYVTRIITGQNARPQDDKNLLEGRTFVISEVADDFVTDEGGMKHLMWNIRHATESEIAEEKERRWWAEYGRGVKEYKKGDIFKHGTQIFEVLRIDESVNYSVKFLNEYENIDGVHPDAIQILCFAENRVDWGEGE